MVEFFHAVAEHAFMRNALMTAVLASVACGIVGSYVVVRRMTFISGGVAHAVLGGMGIAYFLGRAPLAGAVVAAVAAAVLIGLTNLYAGEHEDTLIGALWAVGMATGIIFLYKTPGYAVDLLSYLFGNILMVSRQDLCFLAVLDAAIVLIVAAFYKFFLGICFDEEHARVQGVPVSFFYLLLLTLTALTVVLLVEVVGIVLVIALLTLPAATASQWCTRLCSMMLLAFGVCLIETVGGLVASYGPDLPPGPTIVLLAGLTYFTSTAVRMFVSRHGRRAARPAAAGTTASQEARPT